MLEDLGHRGMVFDDWYGFFAPAGTPQERVDYLADALVRAIRSPDVAAKIREAGSEAETGFDFDLRTEFDKFSG